MKYVQNDENALFCMAKMTKNKATYVEKDEKDMFVPRHKRGA